MEEGNVFYNNESDESESLLGESSVYLVGSLFEKNIQIISIRSVTTKNVFFPGHS